MYTLKCDETAAGVDREKFVVAMLAELQPIFKTGFHTEIWNTHFL